MYMASSQMSLPGSDFYDDNDVFNRYMPTRTRCCRAATAMRRSKPAGSRPICPNCRGMSSGWPGPEVNKGQLVCYRLDNQLCYNSSDAPVVQRTERGTPKA